MKPSERIAEIMKQEVKPEYTLLAKTGFWLKAMEQYLDELHEQGVLTPGISMREASHPIDFTKKTDEFHE